MASNEMTPGMDGCLGVTGIGLIAGVLIAAMWGCPTYNVWQQGKAGEAKLREAEQSRQIAVQEAQAKEESAKHLAQAEIERAKGVAEANRIIGEGLKGHEEYLRYLWVMALEHTAAAGDKVIYVPTETNLPILEAARLQAPQAAPAK